jgi:hypothetical protein
MEIELTMQQMLEPLLAKQEEMKAKMRADREKKQAEMEAIRAKTKAMRGDESTHAFVRLADAKLRQARASLQCL